MKVGWKALSTLMVILFGIGVLPFCNLLWGDIYTIKSQDILTKWRFPEGTLSLTSDGGIKPVFVYKNINACLNATEFEGGIKAAGSNEAEALNAIDGNPATSWHPHEKDELKDWWLEINLGRVVMATRIRLIFSEQGRPFEFFKVYISSGSAVIKRGLALKASTPREYRLLWNVTSRNTKHVLEYDIPAEGELVQYIRFSVTERKTKDVGLAEIEVYAIGENLALGTLRRGGQVSARFSPEWAHQVVDGNVLTGWPGVNFDEVGFARPTEDLEINLGTLFWIDTINLIGMFETDTRFPNEPENPFVWHKIYTSDGTMAPDGSIRWEETVRVLSNPQGQLNFLHRFPAKPIQYIRLVVPTFTVPVYGRDLPGTNGGVDELQFFGEGYPPRLTLRSGLIDLGRESNIYAINWSGDTPPRTKIEVRTRSGDTVKELIHYYDKGGKEISEQKWKKTPKSFRGPTKTELIAGDDWSSWSRPYLHSGDWFLSPSPRRYVELEVKLRSENPFSAPSLRSIILHYSKPLCTTLLGEISPVMVRPGVPETFSYFIQPSFRFGDLGFNQVVIKLSSKVKDVIFIEAKVGGKAVQATAKLEIGALLVKLPRVVRRALVEVRFKATLFRNGTFFDAYVTNELIPEEQQRVDPGDATKLVDSQTTTVSLPVDRVIIGDVSVEPKVITPNKDGVNDEIIFDFSVLKVSQPRYIRVTIYDIGGGVVTNIMNEPGLYGGYQLSWDGRDDSGQQVLPGIYVWKIEVDTDSKHVARMGTITVIY